MTPRLILPFVSLVFASSCGVIQGKVSAGATAPSTPVAPLASASSGGTAVPDVPAASSTTAVSATAATASQPTSTPSSAAVADDQDHDTALAMRQIDAFEKELVADHVARYAVQSRMFRNTLMLHNGWSESKHRDAIEARVDALDVRAIKAVGGRLAAALPDGHRVVKLGSDAIDADVDMLARCDKAAKIPTTGQGRATAELTKAVADYEQALARAQKLDANALRYIGAGAKSRSLDVPTQLMECEVSLAKLATQFGDEYTPETAVTETEKGCGEIDWLADAVAIGGGRFAAYQRTAGGATFPHKLACSALPAHGSAPSGLAAAAKDFAGTVNLPLAKLVIQVDGAPYTEVDDEDLHVHRYQKLKAFSRELQLVKNPCGPDDKLFCEAGGSQTMARYNRLQFELDRAAVHAGTDAELCKKHLKAARAQATWFDGFYKKAVARKAWVAGATYKSKKGDTLSEQQLRDNFTAKGQQAEDEATSGYCAKSAVASK